MLLVILFVDQSSDVCHGLNNVLGLKNTLSSTWLFQAKQKLEPHLNYLRLFLIDDKNKKCYLALASSCALVIQNCMLHLSDFIFIFVDILVVLESFENIRAPSSILKQIQTENYIENFIHHLNTVLKASVNQKNAEFVIELKIIASYIDFFFKNNSTIIRDLDIIRKFLNIFILLNQLKYSYYISEKRIDWKNWEVDRSMRLPCTRKFKDVQYQVESVLMHIATLIGNKCVFPQVFSILFEYLDSNLSNQTTFIVIEMCENQTLSKENVLELLKEYLKDKHWYLKTTRDCDLSVAESEISFNITHICLSIKLVAVATCKLQNSIDTHIFTVLLKLIEKLNDKNMWIYQAALNAVLDIASMHNETVLRYLTGCTDILIPILFTSVRVKTTLDTRILNTIYRFINLPIDIVFLMNIIEKLTSLMTNVVDNNIECLLETLQLGLKRLSNISQTKCNNSIKRKRKSIFIKNWTSSLMVSIDLTKNEQVEFNEELSNPPKTRDLCFINVIENVIDMVSSIDTKLKINALKIIIYGISLIQDNESIFPIIYRIWNYIPKNIQNQNKVVVTVIIELLILIFKKCKKFVEKRFIEEIIPLIISNINSEAAINSEALVR